MYNKLYLFIGLFILLVSLISCAKKESESNTSSTSIFKAVGYSGTILSSPDGITWTSSTWDSQNYGTSKNLSGITYGNSTYVAVGWYSTIISSSDGITWTSSTWDSLNYGTSKNLSGITYGNSTYVAVGWYSTIISS